jgi:hypothetical protein
MSVQTADYRVTSKDRWRLVRARRGALVRRAGWGLADQALSSLTNFALVVVVAHQSSPATFGLFALIFATFSIAMGACRAVCCEPLAVRYSSASSSSWRSGASMATGGAIVMGGAIGVGCMVVGLLVGGQAQTLLLILGVALPGLLLQDAWRYAFFAAGDGRRAFFNDGVYALLLLSATAILLAQGHLGVEGLLALWGSSATVAAIFGVWQARLAPSPTRFRAWWGGHSDLSVRYLAEFVGLTGEAQLMFYGIALVTSLGAVAAVRGGLLLLGPINILGFGALIAGVPEAVRLLAGGSRRLIILSAVVSAALATCALVWGAVIMLIPTHVGVSAIGPVWYTARPLVLPLALGLAALGVVMGAVISLRALAAARRSLRARLLVSPLILALCLIGAALYGAAGVAWALVIGNSFAAIVFWYHLVLATSEHQLVQRPSTSSPVARMIVGAATQPS